MKFDLQEFIAADRQRCLRENIRLTSVRNKSPRSWSCGNPQIFSSGQQVMRIPLSKHWSLQKHPKHFCAYAHHKRLLSSTPYLVSTRLERQPGNVRKELLYNKAKYLVTTPESSINLI